MGKYVLKRILIMIPTLLVVIFIIFALINIMPGDPGRIMLGQDAAQEDVDAINAMLRMDKPLVVRYILYIWDALHLDFGISLLTRQPVFSDLFAKIPITFILALGGTVTSVLIGVPLGVISAVKEHTSHTELLDEHYDDSSFLCNAPSASLQRNRNAASLCDAHIKLMPWKRRLLSADDQKRHARNFTSGIYQNSAGKGCLERTDDRCPRLA